MSIRSTGTLIVLPSLREAKKGPNPENFVPVFDWNSKHIWLWMKNPAGAGVLGPVEVAHNQVKKYAEKLGWLPQKSEYVGQIDPSTYSSSKDIYPALWKPGDSLATGQHLGEPMFAKFKSPKALKSTVKKKAKKLPPEFTLTGKMDPHGHPLAYEEGSGETFSVLPGGKIGQWEEDEGVYYIAKKGEGEWDIHMDSPIFTPEDIAAPVSKPPKAAPIPKAKKAPKASPSVPKYQAALPDHCEPISEKDSNGFPMVRSLPSNPEDDKEKLTLLPNGELARWKSKAKNYLVWEWSEIFGDYNYFPSHPTIYIPLKEVKKLAAQVPAAVKTPSAPKPKPKPKPKPTGELKPTGKQDSNGYPIGSYKGLAYSQVPEGKVAVWSIANGAYILYTFDPNSDSYYSTAKLWAPPGKHSAGASVAIGGSTFAQATDTTGTTAIVLPNGKFAKKSMFDTGNYSVQQVDVTDKKKFKATGETLTASQFVDMAKSLLSPLSLSPMGQVDVNGLPLFSTAEKDPVPSLTLLPNGEYARWHLHKQMYRLYEYDPEEELWAYSEPPEWFALSDVDAMYIKAGTEPAAPPEEPKKEQTLEPTGKNDVNGFPLYTVTGQNGELSMLPNGEMGKLVVGGPHKGEYRKYVFDIDGWWNTSDPPVYYTVKGLKPELGGSVPKPAVLKTPEPVVADTPASIAGKLPDMSELKRLGSGASFGLGGAGEKDIYEDPKTKKRYIFKPSYRKGTKTVEPFRAYAQEAASGLALLVRPEHVPVKTVTVEGVIGTLQPWVDLDPKGTLEGVHPKELTPSQQLNVATDHLMDWALSQHDTYDGNMVFAADGSVLSIDKEQGFKFFGKDKLSTDYNPNPIEPFYNKFWRAFANGETDFDPKMMLDAVEKIRNMGSAEYVDLVRAYAADRFKDRKEQRKLLRKVLARKLALQGDFEEFITGLYKKRTSSEGEFTFDEGWKPVDASETEKPEEEPEEEKKAIFTGTASADQTSGGSSLPSDPFLKHLKQKWAIKKYHAWNPSTGKEDSSYPYVTLKVEITQADSLKRFLAVTGLEPQPVLKDGATAMTGEVKYMVVVKKEDWAKLKFKDTPYTPPAHLHSSFGYDSDNVYPAQPEYPKHFGTTVEFEPPEAKPNVQVLDESVHALMQNPKVKHINGMEVGFDGGDVEGANGRLRKYKDAKGFYLQKQFKLRKEQWEAVNEALNAQPENERKWTPFKFQFCTGPYSKSSGAVEIGTSIAHYTAQFDTFKFSFAEGELYIAKIGLGGADGFKPYSFVASVLAHIRKTDVDAMSVLKTWLNKVVGGLGDKLFKNPTKAEARRKKLFRAAWAFGGRKAKTLKASSSSKAVRSRVEKYLAEQSQYMEGGGYTVDEVLELMEEQEVLPGYSTHVLPGRWRKLAGGALWFVSQGFKLNVIPSVCRAGLLGIHARYQIGVFTESGGGSTPRDTNSGAGDQTQCRLASQAFASHSPSSINSYGQALAIVSPEVLDRMDSYLYFRDEHWGTCFPGSAGWKSVRPLEECVQLGEHWKSYSHCKGSLEDNSHLNEMQFRQGVDVRMILRIVVKGGEGDRQQALQICKGAKVEEVNGIPIEEFVITAQNGQEIWEKYVKPVVGL